MSILREVLQNDVGFTFHRSHSFLSWYAFLSNVPFSLCKLLNQYSIGRDDVHLFIPMLKNDFMQSAYNQPENILNDFPLHTRVLLCSYVAEIFEILANWSLHVYEDDPLECNPFYDASQSGTVAFTDSTYQLLKSNSIYNSILTDHEIYTVLKHESLDFNSNQLELDFSLRKAS